MCEKAVALGKLLLPEWFADKGYYSNETIQVMEELGLRGYISEPNRGRRRWKDKAINKRGTYSNRRRIKGLSDLVPVVLWAASRRCLGADRGLGPSPTDRSR